MKEERQKLEKKTKLLEICKSFTTPLKGLDDILLFLKHLELVGANIPEDSEEYDEFAMVAAIKSNVHIDKNKKAIANYTKIVEVVEYFNNHYTLTFSSCISQLIKALYEPINFKASVSNIATVKSVMNSIRDTKYQHKLSKEDMHKCINKAIVRSRRQMFAKKYALRLGVATILNTTSAGVALLNLGKFAYP